jgi:hypothetical protein
LPTHSSFFKIENADGPRYFKIICIVCPNKKCRHFTADLIMSELHAVTNQVGNVLKIWNLIPPPKMKVFPDYIPKPIVDDY